MVDPVSQLLGAKIINESITTANNLRLVRGGSEITPQPMIRWWLDNDSDNYVDAVSFIDALTRPVGNYLNAKEHSGFDCNDADAAIPYWEEIPNDGLDNDCNGVIDEGTNTGGA